MSIVTYSQPFVIFFSASLTRTGGGDTATIAYCLQANRPAPNEVILLQAYDAGNANQRWVYGSDQRIYLACTISTTPLCIDAQGGSTANYTSLVLSPVNSNQTQQWYPYHSTSPSTYINLASNPGVVIDNEDGHVGPGNRGQVYEARNNDLNQVWTAWVPEFPMGTP